MVFRLASVYLFCRDGPAMKIASGQHHTECDFQLVRLVSAPKTLLPHRRCYLSVSASTPGSFLPSRNSRLAPPPVEICVIWSATPAWLIAETESPPPMIDVAVRFAATALAIALVPTANRGNSNTPAGPFHTIVFAVKITCSMAGTDCGPMSRPCQFSGKSFE